MDRPSMRKVCKYMSRKVRASMLQFDLFGGRVNTAYIRAAEGMLANTCLDPKTSFNDQCSLEIYYNQLLERYVLPRMNKEEGLA